MTNLPKAPPTYTRLSAQGLIEVVDLTTGLVLCVQRTPKDYLALKFEGLTRIDTPDGPVYIEKGIDIDRLRMVPQLAYSKVLVGLICEEIVNGSGIVKACEKIGIKYSLLCAWRQEYGECKEALAQARKDKAEMYAERALQRAEESKRPYLEVETLKWAAEKSDPEKFGQQTKVVGDPNQPIQFILNTGIRRSGDQGFVAPDSPIPPVELEVKKTTEGDKWEVPGDSSAKTD